MKRYNYSESYKWYGSFQTTEMEKQNITGELDYSPFDISFKYFIPFSCYKPYCEMLYGVISDQKTQEACTLIGPFDFRDSGMKLGYNISTYFGKKFVNAIILNHIEQDELFDELSFSFNGLFEFCGGGFAFAAKTKVAKEPIKLFDNGIFTLQLMSDFKYSFVQQLESEFCCESDATYDKIKEFFDTLDDRVYIKRSISKYRLVYKTASPKQFKAIIEDLYAITSIFSLLMCRPTIPTEILLKTKNSYSPVLLNFNMNQEILDYSSEKVSVHTMPIWLNDIDFATIFDKVFSVYDKYKVLFFYNQSSSRKIYLHEIYSGLILFATQLEDIGYQMGAERNEKYQKPLEAYQYGEVLTFLKLILNESEGIGKLLGDLRDELAHAQKPKKLLANLTNRSLAHILFCIRIIIDAYLLKELGVSDNTIKKSQSLRIKPLLPFYAEKDK